MTSRSIPEYDELKLRVQPGPGDTYRVHALASDGSAATCTFRRPLSELELDNFALRVGTARTGTRGHRSSQLEEAKRVGTLLAESLLADKVGELFAAVRRDADGAGRGVRLTLHLDDAPELMEVPWEFLYRDRGFVSQSIYTPVVRSLDLGTGVLPRPVSGPLRILGVVSSPRGFAELDGPREQANLEAALAEPLSQGLVEITWLETATAAELDRVVSAPDAFHVLHYIGHGAYDARTADGVLVLEDPSGNAAEMTGDDLGMLLRDERTLRLALLNSCQGARTSHVDPFSGVATSLLHCGIPAVVGMQFDITDGAAIAFSSRFYLALVQGYPVDAALALARRAVFAAGLEAEFGTPVLYLRGSDTRLFEPVQAPAGAAPRARAGEVPVPLPAVPEAAVPVAPRLAEPEPTPAAPRAVVVPEPPAPEPPAPAPPAPAPPAPTPPVPVPAPDLAQGADVAAGAVAVPEQADAAPTEAPANRTLLAGRLNELESGIYAAQREAVLAAVTDAEELIGLCRAGFATDVTRPVILLLTSERLVWVRETMFSAVVSGSVPWSDVVGVTPRSPEGFVLQMRSGEVLSVQSFSGQGVTLGTERVGFAARELVQWIRRRTGDAPEVAETRWAADVLEMTDQVRVLRVTLDQETHRVEYRVGRMTDKVLLDGQTAYSLWSPRPQGYELVLSDGSQTRVALLRIKLAVTGMRITGMRLSVEGVVLHEE